jgi:hypothetical protein
VSWDAASVLDAKSNRASDGKQLGVNMAWGLLSEAVVTQLADQLVQEQ